MIVKSDKTIYFEVDIGFIDSQVSKELEFRKENVFIPIVDVPIRDVVDPILKI